MITREVVERAIVARRELFSGDRLHVVDGRGTLIFQDNKSDVLLVAHLDWVGETRKPRKPVWRGSRFVQHAALDDRLGVAAIQTLLANGLKADVLYTDCEEVGQTTAAEFVAPRTYSFALSFDRKGVDHVLYKYDADPIWARLCESHFGREGVGSFSCIDSLNAGCCAVNVGIGYHDHNGPDCWADLQQTSSQISKALAFISEARECGPWSFDTALRVKSAKFGKWRAAYMQRCQMCGDECLYTERVDGLDVCDHCSLELSDELSACDVCGDVVRCVSVGSSHVCRPCLE